MSPLTQEQVPTPPPPPPLPSTPRISIGGDGGVTITGFEMPTRPLTAREVRALRQRGSELSNQLVSATNRRNQLASRLATAEGVNRQGIEERIAQLDKRILRLESEIDMNGRLLASVPANLATTTTTAVPVNPFGLNPGQITGITIVGTIFVLFPIAIALARNLWKRGSRQAVPATTRESNERMERLEQAVDAIAIEVERISEGQRFMTRLLTEGPAQPVSVGQRAAEPLRLPDHDPIRASRETA